MSGLGRDLARRDEYSERDRRQQPLEPVCMCIDEYIYINDTCVSVCACISTGTLRVRVERPIKNRMYRNNNNNEKIRSRTRGDIVNDIFPIFVRTCVVKRHYNGLFINTRRVLRISNIRGTCTVTCSTRRQGNRCGGFRKRLFFYRKIIRDVCNTRPFVANSSVWFFV